MTAMKEKLTQEQLYDEIVEYLECIGISFFVIN